MFSLLHNFLPQPIIWQSGLIKIHWYGIFIVLAILICLKLVLILAKKKNINSDQVYDLAFYLILFGLIGGRIYAVLLEWQYYFDYPWEIVAVWHGGLAIHGAIIGSVITLIYYCLKHRQSFWFWGDILAVVLPLGQAIGRWGNYFNQELFGRPTNLPWGIPIELSNRPLNYLSAQYFHPVFLYESILNLINFFILIWFYWHKDNFKLPPGRIMSVYLINYSIIRIVMEFLRLDDTPIVFGLRLPVAVSLMIIVVVAALWRFDTTKRSVL